ncbi:MAG: tyrosine-type recombinase/integrase [Bacillota bacterium]
MFRKEVESVARICEVSDIRWERFPAVSRDPMAKKWLECQVLLGLAKNTVEAYARGVQEFMEFCEREAICAPLAKRDEVARYVGYLRRRPGPKGRKVLAFDSGAGLSISTMQQRLTALRLFFDHLLEEGVRDSNPVGRGRYTPGKKFGGPHERRLLPRLKRLPWIPSDEQWVAFLSEAQREGIRNRCMIGLAYDAALRREEICLIASQDIDPAHRTIRIRAETTKGGGERVVPYSEATGALMREYLRHRRTLSPERGQLFLSESRRNRAVPITFWTWSKVIRRIADSTQLEQFSTHTLRHLRLTDLARAGWDLHEIARFAGHRSLETTQRYIHLSSRDLAQRLGRGMDEIHQWRLRVLAEACAGLEKPE